VEGNESGDPPAYSSAIQSGGTVLTGTHLEGMEEIMNDGIDQNYLDGHHGFRISSVSPFSYAGWSFGNVQESYQNDGSLGEIPAPPASDEADDNLSYRAANGSGSDIDVDFRDRMNDFNDEDEGFNGDGFESTSQPGQGFYSLTDNSPTPDDPPPYAEEEELQRKAPVAVGDVLDDNGEDDEPVAEVHVEEGEGLVAS
jgi:hypothetical protein